MYSQASVPMPPLPDRRAFVEEGDCLAETEAPRAPDPALPLGPTGPESTLKGLRDWLDWARGRIWVGR